MPLDDAFTVALLHMDGTDGSTTFTDESGKTWTANGNAQIDTAQSYFGGASGLFDGTGDYISAGDSADWQLDGGSDSNEWTIDLRVKFAVDPGAGTMGFVQQYTDDNNYWVFMLNNNTLRFDVFSGGSGIVSLSNAFDPEASKFYHFALVKQGVTGYKMFAGGVQVGTTQTDTSVMPDFTGGLRIGRRSAGGTHFDFNGWMDEVRISKGVARWTANFTPPTLPYGQSGGFFF